MNKMVIEYWPTAKLIPYARNPRKNDQAVDRMAASIEEFGFRIPILARSSGDESRHAVHRLIILARIPRESGRAHV